MNEDLSIYKYYNDHIEHQQRTERHSFLAQRLLNIIMQANWNKRILCSPYFSMLNNDLEMHKNRFGRYIAVVETIREEMRQLNVNYNKERLNKIINILTTIQQYDIK